MIDQQRKLIFIHIPKNAGKSIETMISGSDVGNPHWKDLRLLEEIREGRYDDYFRFAVTRNPLDRIVSIYSYYSASQGNKSANDRRIQEVFQGLGFRGLLEQLSEGFGYFEAEIESFRQDLYPHLIPQHRYLEDERGKLLMSHVGRFEDLGATVGLLNSRYRAAFSLPHLNRSERASWPDSYDDELFSIACGIFRSDIERFYDLAQIRHTFERWQRR